MESDLFALESYFLNTGIGTFYSGISKPPGTSIAKRKEVLGMVKGRKLVQLTDVVAVQQNLIEFGDSLSFRRVLHLGDVFQQHVDEVIEAEQCSGHLFVVLHENVDAGADALINKF